MKYFTREIWAGWQGSDAAFDKAMRDWKRNLARHKRSLIKLAPRLGPGAKFFTDTDHSLHDGRLLAFTVSDCDLTFSRKRLNCETVVQMKVIQWNEKKLIFELNYEGIKDISIRTKNDLFPLDISRFGDWGYDEILPIGRTAFQHNILFQTGTELSITFQKFNFRIRKR